MAQLPAQRRQQGGGLTTRGSRHPFELFRRQFDDLFDRMWGGMLTPFDQDFGQMHMWDFGVTENDKEIVVRAEMPGFEEKKIDVRLSENTLTIKAEKEQKGDQEAEYRSFYRTVTLPPGIDAAKVQATYHNGLLELHIPRPQETQAKRIEVRGQQGDGQQGQQATTKQAGNGAQGQQTGSRAKTTSQKSAK